MIQDRQFNRDGTFRYPTSDIPGAVWIGDQGANKLPIWQTAYLAWAITHAHRNGFTAGGLWAATARSRIVLSSEVRNRRR